VIRSRWPATASAARRHSGSSCGGARGGMIRRPAVAAAVAPAVGLFLCDGSAAFPQLEALRSARIVANLARAWLAPAGGADLCGGLCAGDRAVAAWRGGVTWQGRRHLRLAQGNGGWCRSPPPLAPLALFLLAPHTVARSGARNFSASWRRSRRACAVMACSTCQPAAVRVFPVLSDHLVMGLTRCGPSPNAHQPVRMSARHDRVREPRHPAWRRCAASTDLSRCCWLARPVGRLPLIVSKLLRAAWPRWRL